MIIIVGCGSQRPDSVREEIWYNGEKIYSYLQKGISGQELTHEEIAEMKQFNEEYGEYILGSPKFTDEEIKVISSLWFMNLAYVKYLVAVEDNDVQGKENALNDFRENENLYKEVYGN
jgi:hypothetical protein